jgi:enamine deaminase RidA (YjgF/YER057c/UK114 family)
MDIITDAVHGVGASMGDITRTRVLLTDVSPWRSVGEVHAATMAHYGIRPVNTMVGGSTLIGDGILVEVEAMGTVRE